MSNEQQKMLRQRGEFKIAIEGVDRYNPANIPLLEAYLVHQMNVCSYDSAANFTLLKLYQLNPEQSRPEMVTAVLLKCLMALPQTDLSVAKCLIDPAKNGVTDVDNTNVRRALELGKLLESCDMARVWQYLRDNAALVADMNGFRDAVVKFACHIVRITYQTIPVAQLKAIVDVHDDTLLNNLCTQQGWSLNGDLVAVAAHGDTVKTRNIEEKLDFDQYAPVLKMR